MKKKILIVTAFAPGRYAGGAIFTKNLIDDLKKDYDLDVFVISKEQLKNNSEFIEYRVSRITILFNTVFLFFLNPLFISRFSIAALILLKSIVKRNNYSLIWFDYSQTFFYALFFRKWKKILKYHDVIFQKILREKGILKILAIPTFFMEYMFSKISNCLYITPTEKDTLLLKEYYQQKSININHYINDYIVDIDIKYNEQQRYFVFFGDWKRHENEEGLAWFLNNIKLRNGDKIKIIGRNLNKKIQKKLSVHNKYEYLGFVDNPYKLIAGATCLIAPVFRGAGIKIKVLESLACGTTVMGSKIAFEGLPHIFNNYMIQCDTVNDYEEMIYNYRITLEEKQKLRNQLLKYYRKNTAGEIVRKYLNN